MQKEKPTLGNRLWSMLLDHVLTTVILLAPILPFIFLQQSRMQGEPLNAGFQFAFLTLLLLYFLKVSFNGRSLAKRITRLQVVDNRTGEAATPIKCFVRNLPLMIWPVEVLVTFFSPQRRLGDLLAGTRVVNYGVIPTGRFEFEAAEARAQ